MDALKLHDGLIVVIIGGGPAGTSCAIALKNETQRQGIDIKIVLYEGKDFDYLYNQCVGVLSPPFNSLLKYELGIDLPSSLIKKKISGYCLHGDSQSITLTSEDENEPTYVVRRIEFDNFMLEYAKSIGIEVRRARTTYVEFVRKGEKDELRIFGEMGYQIADVVVGAFGLDEAMLGVFEKTTPVESRYRRPKKYLRSYITKIFTDNEFIDNSLGNTIYAFIPSKIPSIEFGAVTPKDDYIMVNIAGKNVTSPDMDAFLRLLPVKRLLPETADFDTLDFFEGMFPTSPAKNPYGDRFVFVGDATGWMRPFKGKGINTALITGVTAARTMVDHGISHQAFQRYEDKCHVLREDYYFGSLVRYLTHVTSKLNLFDYVINIAGDNHVLRKALYNSVSGHDSYKNIIKDIVNLNTLGKTGKIIFKKITA